MSAPAGWCASPLPSDRRSGVLRLRVAGEDHHQLLVPLAAGGLLVAGVLGVVGVPAIDLHGPLHHLGIMDPLCGMTRGTVAVLRGQLELAWSYNPASPLLVAGATLALGRWVVGRLSGRWLTVHVRPSRVAWAVGAVAVLVLWVNQQAHAALLG